MYIKQISVFVENKKGRLAEITEALAAHQIDISAMSIADTTDFGILRLIVNRPDEAESVLRELGFAVKTTQVIAIEVKNQPGGLAAALKKLNEEYISIEYMYSFVTKTAGEALVIMRVESPEQAVAALDSIGVRALSQEEVGRL